MNIEQFRGDDWALLAPDDSAAFIDTWNQHPMPFTWTKDAD